LNLSSTEQIAERQSKGRIERDLAALATINNQLEEKSLQPANSNSRLNNRKELNSSLSTVLQERREQLI